MNSPETESNANDSPARLVRLKPRQMIAQAIGFAIGVALLGWCIAVAIEKGDWSKLGGANPWLLAGLIACTVVSLVVNGVIFWLVGRTIKPLRVRDMVLLNLVTAVLNYAPIRAGMIARIAYNLKVDRMTVLQVVAWFGAVMTTMLLAMGAGVGATLLRPQLDAWWALLLVGILALGGLLVAVLVRHPLIVRHGRGIDVMLRKPACLWGALILRLIDIAAFTGRMACAAAILDLALSMSDVLLMAIATIALTLNPLGRVGFREAGVSLVGLLFAESSLTADQAIAQMTQLALVESAGEAIVAIPLGALALLWYHSRWRSSRAGGGADGSASRLPVS